MTTKMRTMAEVLVYDDTGNEEGLAVLHKQVQRPMQDGSELWQVRFRNADDTEVRRVHPSNVITKTVRVK